jgi:hypothetical protein
LRAVASFLELVLLAHQRHKHMQESLQHARESRLALSRLPSHFGASDCCLLYMIGKPLRRCGPDIFEVQTNSQISGRSDILDADEKSSVPYFIVALDHGTR